MKKHFLFLFLLSQAAILPAVYSQNIAVNDNGALPDTCAILDISSTTKGLLAPRMSKAQRNAIPMPGAGLLIYQNAPDSIGFHYYDGLKWVWLSQSGASSWNNAATGLASNNIRDTIFHMGNVSIGQHIPRYKLDVDENSNIKEAVINASHSNPLNGLSTSVLQTYISSGMNTIGTLNGLTNYLDVANNVAANGVNNYFYGTAHAQIKGVNNNFADASYQIGVDNDFLGNVSSTNIGMSNNLRNSSAAVEFYGLYNSIRNSGTHSNIYCVYNNIYNSGTGSNVYGVYNMIDPRGGGTQYGIYSDVQKPGSFSGYFLGDVVVNPGKIGIGITTPHAPLQFDNSFANRKIVLRDEANNDNWFFGFGINPGELRYQVDHPNSDHVFYSGGDDPYSSKELMRIKGNGNIIIGTGSPGATLQVNGEAYMNGELRVRNAPSPNNYGSLRHTGSSGNFHLDTYGTGGLYLNYFSGSNVCIGNGAGGLVATFYTSGDATLAGTLTQTSDARLKTNIHQLDSSLQNLRKLNGYTYNWKDKDKDKDLQVGVLAQELQKIYPELVKQNPNGELSVNYIGLIPVLIEGMKEQQKMIEAQQQQINEQIKLNKSQQQQEDELKQLINKIINK